MACLSYRVARPRQFFMRFEEPLDEVAVLVVLDVEADGDAGYSMASKNQKVLTKKSIHIISIPGGK